MIVPFRLQAVICAGVHHETDVLLASRLGRTQDLVRGRDRYAAVTLTDSDDHRNPQGEIVDQGRVIERIEPVAVGMTPP